MSAIEELRLRVSVTDLLYDFDNNTYGELTKAVDAVERENAELRELVREAWKCIHSGPSCSDDCRLVTGGCMLESAMRELGVEVDG